MTKSTQGVYLRRLQALRNRIKMLKENVYPRFTYSHAAWKQENIVKLKKKNVYPKYTKAHVGYKPKLSHLTTQAHMDWKRHYSTAKGWRTRKK